MAPAKLNLRELLARELRATLQTLKEKRGAAMTRRDVLEAILSTLGAYNVTKRRTRTEKKAPLSDAEWFAMLRASPAYEGIDVMKEWEACKVWCATKQIPSVTRPRFLSWLRRARADAPLGTGRARVRIDPYKERDGWREILRDIGTAKRWNPDRIDELARGEWGDLPLDLRNEIWKAP